MSIRLYAEFLLNIRQVNIYATLKDARGPPLQDAHIASDRKTITVAYNGERRTIVFPSGIAGTAVANFPVEARQLVSLRLEIAEDDLDVNGAEQKPPYGLRLAVGNDQPWSAASLTADAEMACRACKAVVVEARKVAEWRDLPREHWADMMDLWHCHKPSTEPNGAHPTRDGKYGALGKTALQGETGFVDTCHFLVPEAACKDFKVRGFLIYKVFSCVYVRWASRRRHSVEHPLYHEGVTDTHAPD